MSKRSVSGAAAALVLVCACGAPSGGQVTTGSDPGTVPVTADDADPPPDPSGGDGEGGGEESLAEFFGWGGEDPEAAETDFRAQEARIQEHIRQCMAEQGFDYQPIVPPESVYRVLEETDQEEWIRAQGFGITTWYGNEEQMGAVEDDWVDPNQEALDNMSDSERQAWQDALWGTQEEQEADMEMEIDEETGETIYYSMGYGGGCQGEAHEAEYGPMNEGQDLWLELEPAMQEMYERVAADPRIVEANQQWSQCMAEAGYPNLVSREDIWETVQEDFQKRLEEIVGPDMGYADPFEGWTEDQINAFWEENSPEEIDAFFREAEQKARENVDQDALEALQQEEIDMALADWECSQGWNDLYTEVSQEYEADFIARNRETLEEIRDAQGG